VDYAYGDPGEVVKAGQKRSHSSPDLESLGGLALGAAGLLAWRRRRGEPISAELRDRLLSAAPWLD
jgi:MYXO-CTERM domain-containing protein